MKCFIWQEIDKLTTNYHSRGGLMIVAESLEHAQKVLEETVQSNPKFPDPLHCLKWVDLPIPDCSFNLTEEHTETKIMVFENTGCC